MSDITFYGDGYQLLFTIRPDGTIVRGPGFTTTDAMSLAFWQRVDECWLGLLNPDKKAKLAAKLAATSDETSAETQARIWDAVRAASEP